MELDFWHRRWQKNEIGFHESEGNMLLKEYVAHWQLAYNARVF
ncbi:MAG: thiopurine S-methyltransferase, partial [Glaciecola sp.]